VTVVYRLKDDTQAIALVQQATLLTKDFGIQQTHGLVGSPEWWDNIKNGNLPLQTMKGTISRVFSGSLNDSPEFEVTSNDGEKENFTRECNSSELDNEYQTGRKVEVDYVWQQLKNEQTHRVRIKFVIEIRIDTNTGI
jgi:hypothetical protein